MAHYGSDLGKKRTGLFLRMGLDRCVGDLPVGRNPRRYFEGKYMVAKLDRKIHLSSGKRER
jgi:hypothetical protein